MPFAVFPHPFFVCAVFHQVKLRLVHAFLGRISQIPVYPDGYTVEDVLKSAFAPVYAIEKRLQDVLFSRPNVESHTGVKITKLISENGELKGVGIEDRESGGTCEITCDGLFVAIGLIPENEPFKQLAELNSYGYFDSDERCITKTPGVYVAGDCRSKTVRQLTTAVADGATAALAACQYINGL